jgi:hypothetical protein
MSNATTIIGNILNDSRARNRHRPRRNNKGSKDCSINIAENRALSDQDPNIDNRVTQPQSTRESTRTKSHGPSHVTDTYGIITGLSHRYQMRNTSLRIHHT